MKPHPALALFKRLFDEAKASDVPSAPTHYVEDSVFERELTRADISHPSHCWITYCDWKDEIGLSAYAERLIRAEERRLGLKHIKVLR